MQITDKTFRYTTPPLKPRDEHLEAAGLLQSTAFHILACPEDAEQQVTKLLSVRERNGISKRPLLVWEPAPPFCRPENRDAHLQACKHVDVFSPNHLELMSLFGDQTAADGPFDRAAIETYARACLDATLFAPSEGAKIVVRAGEHGCLIMSEVNGHRWMPPYHEPTSPNIVHPTGAGNAFLGAFTVALQKDGNLIEAVVHGSVAASFAVEQISLPSLEMSKGEETWNGVTFDVRLQAYRYRLEQQV